MNDFMEWMEARGISKSTARVYASKVRTTLRALGKRWDNEAVVQAHFVEAYRTSASFGSKGAAWHRYIEFKAQEGVEVPDYDLSIMSDGPKTRSRLKPDERLPSSVVDAVKHYTSCGIKVSVIPRIRWFHVNLKEMLYRPHCHVKDPAKPSEEWRVESEHTKALFTHAGVRDEEAGVMRMSLPLIPKRFHSDDPMPAAEIRKCLHTVDIKDFEKDIPDCISIQEFDSLMAGVTDSTPAPKHVPYEESSHPKPEDMHSLSDILGYDPSADD